MNTYLRLLLNGALALLLLTGTIAAWTQPPRWRPPTRSTSAGEAGHGPCDLLIGPVRNWCTGSPGTAATVTGAGSAAAAVPAAADGGTGLMVWTVERRA
ncbi:hypothetical protein [Streptomyces sp. NPDC085665]|uniref:hypothetical protein n=1 Tax=Streptomyces sp. NPDC085665 TaxID=3365735 RepID=UPI0037D7D19F